MIIDIHTHTFPDKIAVETISHLSKAGHVTAYTNGTRSGLLESMDKGDEKVDLSIILPVATKPEQVPKINSYAAMANEKDGKRLFSFGCMHPDYPDIKNEIKRIKELGLKGIKIHPVYQGTDIDDKKFLHIIELCAESGLIVITHAGDDIGFPGIEHCSPKMCRNVVDEIGDFPFVLAHMGGWKKWDEVPEYLANTNVYLDTSFSLKKFASLPAGHRNAADEALLDTEGFMRLFKAFGKERVIFGTDCPWSDQASYVRSIRELPLTEEERDHVFHLNAEKLLDLRS